MQSRFIAAVSVFSLLSISSLVIAQSPPVTAAFPWEGEVGASNVYVRSGAGSNWYPTTKLGKGERVLVLGEKFGWYQITPPTGSFSFVDSAMVDRPAGSNKGTIKQDKVYIRAGSKLESRKNSTQVVLNKGETVDIIGEADGFLKINPPPGASLYISKQYVKPVDARLRTGLVERHVSGKPPVVQNPIASAPPAAAPNPTAPPAIANPSPATVAQANPTPAPPTENAIKIPAAKPTQTPITTPPQAAPSTVAAAPATQDKSQLPPIVSDPSAEKIVSANKPTRKELPAVTEQPESTRYKTMLTVLESELVSLLARPLEQQDVDVLRKKYQEIANQNDEYVPSQIAKIRVRQLGDRAQLRLARSEILSDSESIAAYRANMDQERMKIMRRRVEVAMVKYDLEGELWRSYAFAPESKRFRLVEPTSKNTIAYVDVPAETDPNPDHLIGRLVGITTSAQKFSPAARVPIAVAASITDLSPRTPLPGQLRNSEEPRVQEPRTEPVVEPVVEPRQEAIELPAAKEQQPDSAAPANSDETPDSSNP